MASTELSKLEEFTKILENKTWNQSKMSTDMKWYSESFNALLNGGLYVPCIKIMVEYVIDDTENLKKELHAICATVTKTLPPDNRVTQILNLLAINIIQPVQICGKCCAQMNLCCTFCGNQPIGFVRKDTVVMCAHPVFFSRCENMYGYIFGERYNGQYQTRCICEKVDQFNS